MRCIALVASYKVYGIYVLATPTECAKTMELASLCQPSAWNTNYFTIMLGVFTSFLSSLYFVAKL